MRIVRDPEAVSEILRNRNYQMPDGAVNRMLRPLLGSSSLILAEGEEHKKKRTQLGGPLIMPDLKAIVANFEPEDGIVDLGKEMMRLVETVIGSLLGASSLRVGHLVRKCVALAPFRLIGIPADFWYLRQLNRLIENLPTPPWMPQCSDKERRDWMATFIVAGIDTMTADLVAHLVGVPMMPIWWLPRKHQQTGELVILVLSPEHKFGAGFRKCIGERIAKELAKEVASAFTIDVLHADLRLRGLVTQHLAEVTCLIRRTNQLA